MALTFGYWHTSYWNEVYWPKYYWPATVTVVVVVPSAKKGFLKERERELTLDEIRRRDDREVLEFIQIIVRSGVLE